MKSTNAYLEAVKNIPLEIQKETSFSFAVSDKIHKLLTERRMTQKELAKKMGKTEAEVFCLAFWSAQFYFKDTCKNISCSW